MWGGQDPLRPLEQLSGSCNLKERNRWVAWTQPVTVGKSHEQMSTAGKKSKSLLAMTKVTCTYPRRTTTSPSAPYIWYSPEASLTRFRIQESSCVVDTLVECHGLPWWRCSSTRCTARAVAENPYRLFKDLGLLSLHAQLQVQCVCTLLVAHVFECSCSDYMPSSLIQTV